MLAVPGLLFLSLYDDLLVDPLNLQEPNHVFVEGLLSLFVFFGELHVLDHLFANAVIVFLDNGL